MELETKSGGAMLDKKKTEKTFLERYIEKRGTRDLDYVKEWCASAKITKSK